VPEQRPNLLDSLVGTILSQNTTDVNSRRAFKSLKEALPTWRDVLDTDPDVMIEAIRSGGARRPSTHAGSLTPHHRMQEWYRQ
jgi:endonuclease III